MAMTQDDIVSLALSQSQLDSSFLVQGRKILNMVITEQAKDFDWPFYGKSAAPVSLVPGTLSYNLPADFSRSDTIYLYNTSNQKISEILVLEKTAFDRLNAGGTGAPYGAFIDTNLAQVFFNAVPSAAGYSYVLRYFRLPADLATDGTDSNTVPSFQDAVFLVKKLTEWFMEFTDDERQPMKKADAKEKLGALKMNVNNTDGNSKVQLASGVFRGGVRGRWPGGWMGD